MNRLQRAEEFRRAMQLFVETLPEERMLEVPTVFPLWEAGVSYTAGDVLSHGENSIGDPQLYKVIQGHTSQLDWPPDEVSSLYAPMGLWHDGTPLWAQPSGAHDAYNTEDVVVYEGSKYKSLIDGNVWRPDLHPEYWEVLT